VISEKDVKALNGISERHYKFTQVAFVAFTLFQLFNTYHDFSLAVNYGQAMGLDFEGILNMWNAEPELQKQYVGYEVQSLYRLNMAILSLGGALLFVIFSISMSINRNRNKRVMAALEQCGAIKLSKNA
jgi:hypothetical protein